MIMNESMRLKLRWKDRDFGRMRTQKTAWQWYSPSVISMDWRDARNLITYRDKNEKKTFPMLGRLEFSNYSLPVFKVPSILKCDEY